MKTSAEFDIVVYGATGYTGRLVAEHLAQVYGVGRDVKWAMAGRDAKKLAAVRDEIGAPATTPLIAADSDDAAALRTMCDRARCIITTVGPYQLYGSKLVAACAASGTDYLNLSGESNWMGAMIEAHDAEAKRSGARILFSCGFDSIPFELGVMFTQQLAKKRLGHVVPRIKGRVRNLNGSLSGGTVASGEATRAAAAKDPSVIKLLVDPFALTPGFRGADQPRGDKVEQDDDAGAKVGPWLMAPINSKNIHRSNLLQGQPWGTDFVYDEMVILRDDQPAQGFAFPDGKVPKPGEGPTKAEREAGFYDLIFIGIDRDGRKVQAQVYGKKDPGYGSTAMILAETALCLLSDGAGVAGGISVPGAALGQKLIDRLQARAQLSFKDETK
jgi:short subunit dehydrogenase-like uncharacterized protein